VGTLFIEERITVESYPNLLAQFIVLLETNERGCWFQQDGATFHTAKTTIAFLQDFYGYCCRAIIGYTDSSD
jgi:hypothetical protein